MTGPIGRVVKGSVAAFLMLAVFGAAVAMEAPVADAARKGDHAAVRQLLAGGADVNAAQGDGMTALHWAAERGDVPLADMLLVAGATPSPVTRIGAYTPLHVAARNGHGPVSQRLLEAGADPESRATNSGVTPMHLAAQAGSSEVIEALAAAGGDVDAREAAWGQTPLIFAAGWDRWEAITTLLALGADPEIRTATADLSALAQSDGVASRQEKKVLEAFGVTAETATPSQLQAAVEAGRQAFLEREAEQAAKAEEAAAEAAEEAASGESATDDEEDDDSGSSRRRARPTISSKGGMTALLHAARQGHAASALALLEGGADIDGTSDSDGTSPLLIATINGQFDLAMTFLARGADPNLASTLNDVAPLWATVNAAWQPRTRYPQPQEQSLQTTTYLELIEALLDAGADPDARISMHPWYMVYNGCGNRNCGLIDTNGSTAFLRAAYAIDIPAMKMLVAHGADPNIPTRAPAPNNRRSPDEFLREQAKNRVVSDSAFEALDEEDRVKNMITVRDGLPDSLKTEFPDFAIESNPEEVRVKLVRRVEVLDSLHELAPDPSGLPAVPQDGPGVFAIHAASGVGYGEGFAGNAHRHAPDAWLDAVKYLVEELGADVNARDYNAYNAIHHAAARGDNEMILYLVSKGGDPKAISRRGQSTVDLANGPVQRVSPFPATVALLERLGAINNHNCMSCQ